MVYVQMEYYETLRKTTQTICCNMNGTRGYHAEWSQSEKKEKE